MSLTSKWLTGFFLLFMWGGLTAVQGAVIGFLIGFVVMIAVVMLMVHRSIGSKGRKA
ncbi:MAG: hypothetical protein AAF376_07070 [Pseudomonadota bacterium]